jgi:phage repressor protein C with HTH and peptisase S24 domain
MKKENKKQISDRVEELMKLENLNPNSLAKALGYKNNGTIYDIVVGKLVQGTNERKKTNPGSKLLEKISQTFGVRYKWLLEGEYPIYEAQEKNLVKSDIKLIELPYIDFYAAASFKEDSGNGLEYISEKTRKIMCLHDEEFYDGTTLIRALGDSMEPTFVDDALLLARKIEKVNWQYINNAVYAVFFGGRYEIKRVVDNDIKSKGYLLLIADNPKHGQMKVDVQDIHQILKIEEIVQSKVY